MTNHQELKFLMELELYDHYEIDYKKLSDETLDELCNYYEKGTDIPKPLAEKVIKEHGWNIEFSDVPYLFDS